jgi:CubicO group peptidase (beta-lactamase class C family)
MRDVGDLISAAVSTGGVPGVVAMAGRGPDTFATWVAGQICAVPGYERPMTADTVFDIASLTKVVATTTATLALIGSGRLSLDDCATRYLPSAAPVTVRQLLTHTSGLPASRRFHQWCGSREELLRELYQTPLEAQPGTRVAYSDLGFMLLGSIVSAVACLPLDHAVHDLVSAPLGMIDTGFTPAGPRERFAATEVYDGLPWTGVVHDENARVLGGVAGHAGLFATAGDLARFAGWWAGTEDEPVPRALRRLATTCQTGDPGPDGSALGGAGLGGSGLGGAGLGGPELGGSALGGSALGGRRGFGWVCPGDRYDILGGAWPPTAVSHTGFTGTSLALDPVSGLWVVLLTNGVHFGRDATAVIALRRDIHAALAHA